MTMNSLCAPAARLVPRLLRICLLGFVWAASVHAYALGLQGHRGTCGLMPKDRLAAFQHALKLGVTTLERLQCQFPQQRARDGQRIPTLAALFQRVDELGATDVRLDIETKVFPPRPGDTLSPEGFVNTLLPVIREAGMLLRDRASVANMVKSSDGAIWWPAYNNLNAPAAKSAQQLGLKVIPWTVNEAADIDRLISLGVDGIISDYPDRLRAGMRRAALPLPPGLKR